VLSSGRRHCDHPCEQRRELFLVHRATHNLERGCGGEESVGPFDRLTHSGMFPCFLGGSEARFVRKARKARTTCARVSEGSMTASTYPRSAAS
jgi:hypothetical protein